MFGVDTKLSPAMIPIVGLNDRPTDLSGLGMYWCRAEAMSNLLQWLAYQTSQFQDRGDIDDRTRLGGSQ